MHINTHVHTHRHANIQSLYHLNLTFLTIGIKVKSVCLLSGCRSLVAECLCVIQAILDSISDGDQIFLILYHLKQTMKEREFI